jgi:hypothetical protein
MTINLGRALGILGAGFLLSISGIIVLAVLQRPTPDVLQTLAVGSMTAIGALLARGGRDDSGPGEAPGRPTTPG